MNTIEHVILVNEEDVQIGTMEKMEAHQQGLLHRAFSVLVINSKGEWLLHKRAKEKYHSGGLWTNTCCSHPRPGESTEDAARRRLQEEMGLDCFLTRLFQFSYKAEADPGIWEHEVDHVFIGHSDDLPKPDLAEVDEFGYFPPEMIENELNSMPSKYTVWFRILFPQVKNQLEIRH